jgi:hypothetical protein
MARVASPASGSVVLDTDRRPPHKTILAIRTLLSTQVPDLRPDSVTISDQSGKFYLEAGDPSVASATESGARGEELRDALVENLSPSIRGIDVVVTVEPAPAPAAAAVPPPAPSPPPTPAAPAEETKANTPIGLDDGPPSEAEVAPVDVAKPAPVPPVPTPSPTPAPCLANVWVKVPRSYYLQIYRDNSPGHQPSPEDLEPYRLKTEKLIKNAVAILLPSAERGQVFIDNVVDDAGAGGPLVVPAGAEGRRLAWPAWGPPAAIGATAGLGVALVFGAGLGLLARRRPAGRPSRSDLRSGLSVDAPSGAVPGPSERVRDLVRRDPGAAAGVLQRWIGQGEGGADG